MTNKVAIKLSNNPEHSELWHTFSECHYSKCHILIYGDIDSIVDSKVFCERHYRMIFELREIMKTKLDLDIFDKHIEEFQSRVKGKRIKKLSPEAHMVFPSIVLARKILNDLLKKYANT